MPAGENMPEGHTAHEVAPVELTYCPRQSRGETYVGNYFEVEN